MAELAITLYRWTTRGMRKWVVAVDGPCYSVVSGIVNGTMTLHSSVAAEGKNIGKKNETTPAQQAVKEARALAKLKLKEGWYASEEEAGQNIEDTYRPMLASNAKDYTDAQIDALLPLEVQYKLNGMRGTVRFTENGQPELWSRKNNQIHTMRHIERELDFVAKHFKWVRWDGELYRHGMSLQKIVSIVKRQDHPDAKKLSYHIYDVMNNFLTRAQRSEILRELVLFVQEHDLKHIRVVGSSTCVTRSELNMALRLAKDLGYEGTVWRKLDATYYHSQTEGDRSDALIKDKGRMDSAEFEILALSPDNDGGATLHLRAHNGGQFKARMQGTNEERASLWSREVIGKLATVNYFGLSDEGIPQNPTAEVIRDYE